MSLLTWKQSSLQFYHKQQIIKQCKKENVQSVIFFHANYCTLIEIEMLIFIKQNISILVWNIFHLNLNHICIKSFLILCNICKKFWVFGEQTQQYKSKKGIWEALWKSGFVAFAVFSTHSIWQGFLFLGTIRKINNKVGFVCKGQDRYVWVFFTR